MTRHLKKPQGLRTSKIGTTINANGLAWFRRYLEAMLCIAAVMEKAKSALPPKADIRWQYRDVCFVPKADIPELVQTIAPQQNWPTPLGELAPGDGPQIAMGRQRRANADFAMHSRRAEVSTG